MKVAIQQSISTLGGARIFHEFKENEENEACNHFLGLLSSIRIARKKKTLWDLLAIFSSSLSLKLSLTSIDRFFSHPKMSFFFNCTYRFHLVLRIELIFMFIEHSPFCMYIWYDLSTLILKPLVPTKKIPKTEFSFFHGKNWFAWLRAVSVHA